MPKWILENKEWLFSGIGLFVISSFWTIMTFFCYVLYQYFFRKKSDIKQKSGKQSVQVGGDVKGNVYLINEKENNILRSISLHIILLFTAFIALFKNNFRFSVVLCFGLVAINLSWGGFWMYNSLMQQSEQSIAPKIGSPKIQQSSSNKKSNYSNSKLLNNSNINKESQNSKIVNFFHKIKKFFFEETLQNNSKKIQLENDFQSENYTPLEYFIDSNTYDPKILMPLSVGNSWTYKWHYNNYSSTPIKMMCRKRYKVENSQSLTARSYRRVIKNNHIETYLITNQINGKFYFKISVKPSKTDLNLIVRDGRYKETVQKYWKWTTSKGGGGHLVGLYEICSRNWDYHIKTMFSRQGYNTDDLPLDNLTAINILVKKGQWKNTTLEIKNADNIITEKYDPTDKEIQVEAGRFNDCFETIHISKDKDKIYKTHTFWAPNVGMVKEYQAFVKDDNEIIIYHLDLQSYNLVELNN